MRLHAVGFPIAAAGAGLLLIAGAFGQQLSPDNRPAPAIEKAEAAAEAEPHILQQSFPPNGVMETAWKVEWATQQCNGLLIKNAWYKRSPQHDWLQVLGEARVSELFVPYHAGDPRFWDVSQYKFNLAPVTQIDAGPFGKLHVSNNGSKQVPCVVEEVRDRGIIWKSSEGVRRGHVAILWGCIDAANYRYIIEYGFQDDGCITFRVGASGHNYRGRENTPHMHNTLWRIDVNLDGADHNTALIMERSDPMDDLTNQKAQLLHSKFNNGVEGGADWDASKFTMVRVINTEKHNARGLNYAYDLVPARMGNSRHYGKGEECTLHDFWVTKANPTEVAYRSLPSFCNGESIEDTDIVLWYSAPAFHDPRTEDGISLNDSIVGCTHVNWSSFTLRPTNIFDRTPLYPYDTMTKGKNGK
jgi:primary-amine oxidase